jgi:hypothetical protein
MTMPDTVKLEVFSLASSGFSIPDLYCPFPSGFTGASHPLAAEIETETYELLGKLGAPSEFSKTLSDIFIGEYAGRLYPESSRPELDLAVRYFLVFFWHDDWAAQRDRHGQLRSAAELNSAYDRALAVFDGAPAVPGDPLLALLVQHLARALDSFACPEYTARFRHALDQYLRAYVWKVDHLRRGDVPPLAVYRRMRRLVVGTLPVLELHPLIFRLPVPAHVLGHPVIRQLCHMMVNYIAWGNDLLSLARELAEGSTVNLVWVLCQERGLSLQQGIDAAAEAVQQEAVAYLALKERLPALGTGLDGTLLELLDRTERWAADGIPWHLGSPRYSVTAPATGHAG